jgi:hypothetical protein
MIRISWSSVSPHRAIWLYHHMRVVECFFNLLGWAQGNNRAFKAPGRPCLSRNNSIVIIQAASALSAFPVPRLRRGVFRCSFYFF